MGMKKAGHKVVKKEKKSIVHRVISRFSLGRKAKKGSAGARLSSSQSLAREKETIEKEKFDVGQKTVVAVKESRTQYRGERYQLPLRYGDNRIVLLPRDPWWLYTYWDITNNRINEVVSSIPLDDRASLKWTLRVYNVTGVANFKGNNANSFFDIDINFDAGNWYINANQPESDWCVEIGLKTPGGRFYAVARSNIIKTPCFGISNIIDEEWALPDEYYYKILGVYDLGKSSLERRKKFEEFLRHQISSPISSWGMSSLFSERPPVKDKFFLEVWTEIILHGRTEADAEVTLEGKKIDLRPDGTFTRRYAMPVGDYKFEVTGVSKNKKHKITKIPGAKRFDIVK